MKTQTVIVVLLALMTVSPIVARATTWVDVGCDPDFAHCVSSWRISLSSTSSQDVHDTAASLLQVESLEAWYTFVLNGVVVDEHRQSAISVELEVAERGPASGLRFETLDVTLQRGQRLGRVVDFDGRLVADVVLGGGCDQLETAITEASCLATSSGGPCVSSYLVFDERYPQGVCKRMKAM